MRKKNKVKIGVIGTGIGSWHIRGYKELDNCEVVALADLDPIRGRRVAEEFGVPKVFTSYQELLAEEDIDGVSVCTPNYLHSTVSIAAMEAGKHVLCEKPMALNVTEAQRMVEVARKTGRKFMMGFNQRYRADHILLKRYVDSGTLGEIYFAKTGWIRRKGTASMGSWFPQKALSGGGPLIDLGVHMIDLALWEMGSPKPISVLGSTYTKFGKYWEREEPPPKEYKAQVFDVEDFAFAMIRLDNGATLSLEVSWACFTKEESFFLNLYGTKGGINLRPLELYTERYGNPLDVALKFNETSGFEAQVAHFVQCIAEDKDPTPNGEDGLGIMKVIDAIYKSAETGREVKID